MSETPSPSPASLNAPMTAQASHPSSPESMPASPWAGAATDHYENFPVGSWLVPARLRPAIAALYRFARHADDVADEGEMDDACRLQALSCLRLALRDASVAHPAVDPLHPLIAAHRLDPALLERLLDAFEQDVRTKRHADREAILRYCECSANPIGRLMLQLFDVRDERCLQWSDAICTALQLINFLQDVAIDWRKGRVYLPQAALAAAGLNDADIGAAVRDGRCPDALRDCLRVQAHEAGALLESGRPLIGQVPFRLGLELRAIVAGGRRVLDKLAACGFDPIAARPSLGMRDLPAILVHMLR